MILIESDFNSFLKNYGIYLVIGLIVVVIISLLALFLSYRKNKIPDGASKVSKNKSKEKVLDVNEYLLALGGKENIVSSELKGSRIVLVLINYDKVERSKFKELGVTSFIQMSNKLTLVIEGDASRVFDTIFK